MLYIYGWTGLWLLHNYLFAAAGIRSMLARHALLCYLIVECLTLLPNIKWQQKVPRSYFSDTRLLHEANAYGCCRYDIMMNVWLIQTLTKSFLIENYYYEDDHNFTDLLQSELVSVWEMTWSPIVWWWKKKESLLPS